MPWLETSPMSERWRLIEAQRAGYYDMTEFCARYGVSRKTGYKWLERFEEEGKRGLAEGVVGRPAALLHRGPHAEQPGVELVVGRAHQPRRRIPNLRVLGDVDEITAGRQLASAGEAVSVDLRDDRLREVPDPEPAFW